MNSHTAFSRDEVDEDTSVNRGGSGESDGFRFTDKGWHCFGTTSQHILDMLK